MVSPTFDQSEAEKLSYTDTQRIDILVGAALRAAPAKRVKFCMFYTSPGGGGGGFFLQLLF